MDKQTLVDYINLSYSTYQIATLINKSQTTVRFWLKKYNIKTNRSSLKTRLQLNITPSVFCCSKCKITKDISNFYQRKNKLSFYPYCKSCATTITAIRSQQFKIKCLDYKGGCCSRCGYNKYVGALEFHHLDPTKKDFGICQISLRQFNDTIKKELDKCIILCSNCHKEVHNELRISNLQ